VLTALSLNCWKNEGDLPKRLPKLAAGLAALSPDIACLQEVYADASLCAARTLAQAAGLAVFAHPMRTKDRGAGRSTAGLAVLTNLPIRRAEALALPSNAEDGGRFAQSVDLDSPLGPMRVVNLHLTHLRQGDVLRAAQLEAALAWARTDWTGPILVAGDLNARADSPALRALFAAPDVIAGPPPAPTATSLLYRPGWLIDHVALLQGAGLALERSLALEGPAAVSDHAGVVAAVRRATNL
jgi:endonuclease/exonuclease/phosphatase family metal-dependent hydrolase